MKVYVNILCKEEGISILTNNRGNPRVTKDSKLVLTL